MQTLDFFEENARHRISLFGNHWMLEPQPPISTCRLLTFLVEYSVFGRAQETEMGIGTGKHYRVAASRISRSCDDLSGQFHGGCSDKTRDLIEVLEVPGSMVLPASHVHSVK